MSAMALSDDQRDCLQELSNIAMGQAADSLARFLEIFVHLSVPNIRLVCSDDIPISLNNIPNLDVPITAVVQSFYESRGNSQLRGEAIVLFNKPSATVMSQFLADKESTFDEGLLDISNLLIGACLNCFADQVDSALNFSAPSIIAKDKACNQILSRAQFSWKDALLIEINYTFEQNDMSCDMILLLPDKSVSGLLQKVDQILEEL